MRLKMFVCAMLCFALQGCTYLANRGRDVVDIFNVQVGVGPGLHAGASVGPLRTGLGYANAVMVGNDYGSFVDYHDAVDLILVGTEARGPQDDPLVFQTAPFGFSPAPHASWSESSAFFFIPPGWITNKSSSIPATGVIDRWGGIDLELQAFARVTVGFRPFEIIDLVTGIFGWDLFGDDIETEVKKETAPAENSGAANRASRSKSATPPQKPTE